MNGTALEFTGIDGMTHTFEGVDFGKMQKMAHVKPPEMTVELMETNYPQIYGLLSSAARFDLTLKNNKTGDEMFFGSCEFMTPDVGHKDGDAQYIPIEIQFRRIDSRNRTYSDRCRSIRSKLRKAWRK